jgi:hypothetical protein
MTRHGDAFEPANKADRDPLAHGAHGNGDAALAVRAGFLVPRRHDLPLASRASRCRRWRAENLLC